MFGIVSIIFIFLTWEFFKSVSNDFKNQKRENSPQDTPIIIPKPSGGGSEPEKKKPCRNINCESNKIRIPNCKVKGCPGRPLSQKIKDFSQDHPYIVTAAAATGAIIILVCTYKIAA
jgi:hypothetical protein